MFGSEAACVPGIAAATAAVVAAATRGTCIFRMSARNFLLRNQLKTPILPFSPPTQSIPKNFSPLLLPFVSPSASGAKPEGGTRNLTYLD